MKDDKEKRNGRRGRPAVLILSQHFYPELVSTGQTLTELAEVLADKGAAVSVLCGPPTLPGGGGRAPRRLIHGGIEVSRVRSTRFPKSSTAGRFLNQMSFVLAAFSRLLRDPSPAPILAVTNPPFLGAVCGLIRVFKRRPFIQVIFDLYPDSAVRAGFLRETGLPARTWDRMNRWTLERASAVVVLGRAMKERVLAKGRRGSGLAEKIRVIPIWSDDRIIRPIAKDANPLVREWGLQGRFVVLYSGNMGRFHDMETIMAAARALVHEERIIFLLVGDGQRRGWMERFARRHELDNCRFLPLIPRDRFGLSLALADAGLAALKAGQEGLSEPSKTLGLMAAGVPVLAVLPRLSEMTRIIEETGSGLAVPPGDVEGLVEAILRLYHNPGEAKVMGQRGREAVIAGYGVARAAASYLDLIKETMSRAG